MTIAGECRKKINFVPARQMIREALREDEVAERIDQVVAEVLGT